MRKTAFRLFAMVMAMTLILSMTVSVGAKEILDTHQENQNNTAIAKEWDNAIISPDNANQSGTYKGDPFFMLGLMNPEGDVDAVINAYLVEDPNSNATYLISADYVKFYDEKDYTFVLLGDNDYTEFAEYVGSFGANSLLKAPGLEGASRLLLSGVLDEGVSVVYRSLDSEENMVLYEAEFTADNLEIFDDKYLVGDETLSKCIFFGAPVLDTETDRVVGTCTDYGDEQYLAICPLAGATLPVKHAIEVLEEAKTSQEESAPATEPDAATEPEDDPEVNPDPEPEWWEDKITLLIGGAVLVAVILFLRSKKKAKQAEKQTPVPQPPMPQPPVPNINQGAVPKTEMQNVTTPVGPQEGGATVMPNAVWQLRSTGGIFGNQVFPINGLIRLGRSSECDIRFPEGSPGISSRHCMVVVRGNDAIICDMGSSFGTYLQNGTRLRPNQNYALQAGMEFRLGSTGGPGFVIEKA